MRASGVHFGIVSGSDEKKVTEQLTQSICDGAEYCFYENGLNAYAKGKLIERQSFKAWMGEEKLKTFINFCLHYIADLDIPIKRGTFVEYRNGMLNVSPIGRNCAGDERDEFEKYDKEHKIRETFIAALKEKFPDYGLRYSIGGQISFDVFPLGWDKSFCLKFIEKEYDEMHFFGDKCYDGGNDYEIFLDERTVGHSVTDPEDCIAQITSTFKL